MREHKKELDSCAFVSGIVVIFHTIKNLGQIRGIAPWNIKFYRKMQQLLHLPTMVCKKIYIYITPQIFALAIVGI
jgi:hypothetical protein